MSFSPETNSPTKRFKEAPDTPEYPAKPWQSGLAVAMAKAMYNSSSSSIIEHLIVAKDSTTRQLVVSCTYSLHAYCTRSSCQFTCGETHLFLPRWRSRAAPCLSSAGMDSEGQDRDPIYCAVVGAVSAVCK